MDNTPQAVAGYDDDGNARVFMLAPGDSLPEGLHPKPPPGTHPHERAIAAAAAAAAAAEAKAAKDAELEKEWRSRPMATLVENLEMSSLKRKPK